MMKINRLPESDLPGLPPGWEWTDSAGTACLPCWDADSVDGYVTVFAVGDIDTKNAPPEVVALVKYANGLGPDPRVVKPAVGRRIASLAGLDLLREAVAANPKIDARVRAALILLEEA